MAFALPQLIRQVSGWLRQAYAGIKSFIARLFNSFKLSSSTSRGESSSPSRAGIEVRLEDGSEVVEDHPVLTELRKRATRELFGYLGLTHVPGQFWPLLAKHRDPITALREFVEGIGCNFKRVQELNPAEIERVQKVIDFLELGNPLFERLNPTQKAEIHKLLRKKHYDSALTLARMLADLQYLLDTLESYRTTPTLNIKEFHSFAEAVRNFANSPSQVSESEVQTAKDTADYYTSRIDEFRRCNLEFQDLLDSIDSWFRPEWLATPIAAEIGILSAGGEDARRKLAGEFQTLDEVDGPLAILRDCIAALKQHREASRARSRDDTSSKRSSSFDGREARIRSALRFFGFAEDEKPEWQEIKKAWRSILKHSHPDKFASDIYSDEDRKGAKERTQQATDKYRELEAYFRC